MNYLPPSGSESTAFALLHPLIQHWIWREGWAELRDVQERAIPLLLPAQSDVVLSSATASGKTEAAFLPILTHLLQNPAKNATVFYISPLKALINDQWGRLERLCEELEIPVYPWHGEISASRKQHFWRNPQGVVLITPESLEAMLFRRGQVAALACNRLAFCVVDELHAFFGSERGRQLQSLLHRVEIAAQKRVSRVGLSATLGDLSIAAEFLRPDNGAVVQLIESHSDSRELRVMLKGYAVKAPAPSNNKMPPQTFEVEAKTDSLTTVETAFTASVVTDFYAAVGAHLFRIMRGQNNLIFPNSREKVELLADYLRRECEAAGQPNEFWPHHGSLSRDIREETERQLKQGERPATAIATTTLELGLDIGAVRSVAQIGPPPSVASLRQRLGRSGRRAGEPSILWAYCSATEPPAASDWSAQLREDLVQTVAVIRLLVAGWCEPPNAGGLHCSTLVQQLLSIIGQHGGIKPMTAWRLLCQTGPFKGFTAADFAELLCSLGRHDLLMQDPQGTLLLGPKGEQMTRHFSFYAAFADQQELRVEHRGQTIGSIGPETLLRDDSHLILAGHRWRILEVDLERRLISVQPAHGGAPPTFGSGDGFNVHDAVRAEMKKVLTTQEQITFLDPSGQALLHQARQQATRLDLAQQKQITSGGRTYLFLWHGDVAQNTLTHWLSWLGLTASNEGICLNIQATAPEVNAALEKIAQDKPPEPTQLLSDKAGGIALEKWDWAVPTALLVRSQAAQYLDLPAARQLAAGLVANL